MNVTLKSFSEDISLTDPKNPRRFLVLESEGEEFRVPVGADAIQAIAEFVFKKRQASVRESELITTDPELADLPELSEGADEFSGSIDDSVVQSNPEPDAPESEEEIPSL